MVVFITPLEVIYKTYNTIHRHTVGYITVN